MITSKLVPIEQLHENKGQVKDLPKNPRTIKTVAFDKLVKSIKQDPDMLELREIIAYDTGEELVVIGGNMRLKASIQADLKELPTKILSTDTPVEKLQRILIKDNVSGGDWDWDELSAEWDEDDLNDWGLALPHWGDHDDDDDESLDDKLQVKKDVVCPDCGCEFQA